MNLKKWAVVNRLSPLLILRTLLVMGRVLFLKVIISKESMFLAISMYRKFQIMALQESSLVVKSYVVGMAPSLRIHQLLIRPGFASTAPAPRATSLRNHNRLKSSKMTILNVFGIIEL